MSSAARPNHTPNTHAASTDKFTATKPQVVFFGSGPVAAESLKLLAQWCNIEAVVTKPKPPHHREAFPVLTVAEAHGFPVFTASNRRELDEVVQSNPFVSRAAVLIDFGIIVSRTVIDSFELGIVNSHFSILPEWRGADPITFAILSGQKQTGVSLMMLVEAMDEGPLIGYGEYNLPQDITTPALTHDLILLSDALLRHNLPRLLAGEASDMPQTVTGREVSYSRKLTKADGILDFAKPAEQLEREIRAFAEWPKSRTQLGGKDVIITKAHVISQDGTSAAPGAIDTTTERGIIVVQTGKDALGIDHLKPAGKGEMTTQAFLAGNKL